MKGASGHGLGSVLLLSDFYGCWKSDSCTSRLTKNYERKCSPTEKRMVGRCSRPEKVPLISTWWGVKSSYRSPCFEVTFASTRSARKACPVNTTSNNIWLQNRTQSLIPVSSSRYITSWFNSRPTMPSKSQGIRGEKFGASLAEED